MSQQDETKKYSKFCSHDEMSAILVFHLLGTIEGKLVFCGSCTDKCYSVSAGVWSIEPFGLNNLPLSNCNGQENLVKVHDKYAIIGGYFPSKKQLTTSPNFSQPSSRMALVYQSFFSRMIADRLLYDWIAEKNLVE